MKKSLAHLPQDKQDELELIRDIILEKIPDVRYKKEYRITRKQLEYLGKRVKVLQRLTNKVCKEKIESFVWL